MCMYKLHYIFSLLLILYIFRSYELDETFPNTVVVTIDATHHVRMPPGLMRHMHNHIHANHTHPNIHQNTTQPSKYNICYMLK